MFTKLILQRKTRMRELIRPSHAKPMPSHFCDQLEVVKHLPKESPKTPPKRAYKSCNKKSYKKKYASNAVFYIVCGTMFLEKLL